MLAEWLHPPSPSMMWLMYGASYLFSTRGVRWALDPILPRHLVKELPTNLPLEPLSKLSFVLLTHDHSDHRDDRLVESLRGTGVRVVAPGHIAARVRTLTEPGQVIEARPGEDLELAGIHVHPFPGLHWVEENGRRVGIDAVGYRVEANGQLWLFPGDVRDYDAEAICHQGPADLLFAHLWLGRGQASLATPPLLEPFCRFLLACTPKSVVLTHLYEFSRDVHDLWHQRHADLVRARWASLAPSVPLIIPEIGEGVILQEPREGSITKPG